MSDKETTIKVLPFNGKTEDWPAWSEKFLARGRRKGYKGVLQGTVKCVSDADVANSSDEELKVREENELAYEDLILSIDSTTPAGRVAFNLVKGAKTNDISDGDATLAWTRLNAKYEPKAAPSRLMLKNKFLSSKMRSNEDPDVWLTELEDLSVDKCWIDDE